MSSFFEKAAARAIHGATPGPAIPPAPLRPPERALAGAILVVVIGCYWLYVPTRFFPWDDGSMAQMAERVAGGEVPHRDFRDTYSGLLNYWHALGLAVLGRDFLSLRLQLVAVFALALVAYTALARRMLGPRLGLLLAATAALFGPLQYAGPMPSWYNECLAIAACWCVARFAATGRVIWLAAAGLACGTSIAVKIVGVYALGAAVAAILWLEQLDEATGTGRPLAFLIAKTLGFAIACALVLRLLAHGGAGTELLTLGAPVVLLAALVVADDWRRARGPSGPRLRRCAARLAPFALGAVLPLAVWTLPYWSRAGLATLWQGVVVLPGSRLALDTTHGAMPGLATMTLPFAATALLALAGAGRSARSAAGLAALVLLVAAVALGSREFWYLQPWGMLRAAPCLASALTVLAYVTGIRRGAAVAPMAVGVCWFAALTALVQFPFPHGIYALYAAPLGLLAWTVAAAGLPGARALPPALLLGALAASAILFDARSDIRTLGVRLAPAPVAVPMNTPGASLLAPTRVARTYQALVAEFALVAGRCVYAGPDAPEIPFLARAGYCHPALYDIFEPGYADKAGFERALFDWLARARPAAVVLNLRPAFSRPYSGEFTARLRPLYTRWVLIDDHFLVGTAGETPSAAATGR
ncbi:MAG: hypothetical protein HY749_17100 [Gammaproteobacteria bacterium]|nr:hypothetical protein [Gammaproteobacteria bacterium]